MVLRDLIAPIVDIFNLVFCLPDEADGVALVGELVPRDHRGGVGVGVRSFSLRVLESQLLFDSVQLHLV